MFDFSFLVEECFKEYIFLIINKSEKMQILFIKMCNVLYGIKCVYENVSKSFNFFVVW